MFDMKYLFPGQLKYFDFLLLLQTTQGHSGASRGVPVLGDIQVSHLGLACTIPSGRGYLNAP